MKKLLFLIVSAIVSAFFWDGSQINFVANDLAAARFKAGQEGKLIVVQFGARWCLPCNIMYEGAWQNEDVVRFTNQNFVAVKMDIDQFDAMKLRDKLGVESIPATIVMSSKGDEIQRFEGAMGSESLLGFLQTYAAPEHRSKINAAPLREIQTVDEKKPAAIAEAQISADSDPDVRPEEAETEPKKGLLNQAPPRQRPDDLAKSDARDAARPKQKADEKAEKEIQKAAPAPKTAPRAQPKDEAPLAYSSPKKAEKAAPRAAEKAPEKARKGTARTGFTTQIGVFATPGQAEKLATELSKRYGKRAFLTEGSHNGRKIMRALLGEFPSRDEAAAFRNRLKNSGHDAFVKSWSEVR